MEPIWCQIIVKHEEVTEPVTKIGKNIQAPVNGAFFAILADLKWFQGKGVLKKTGEMEYNFKAQLSGRSSPRWTL